MLFVTVLIEAFFNAVNWILVNRSISLYPLLVIIAMYLVAANTDGPHRTLLFVATDQSICNRVSGCSVQRWMEPDGLTPHLLLGWHGGLRDGFASGVE
ncbi:hypothetical protein CYMTET_56543 [Cymbomonas tetramitiformis]|uniref:Uncharacterized protein n=1 Tax=Cymbomonas tetramitiformis TaxID=36881 RepID=A0AAE0BBX7_9CHLO|nr:hypothetical protein CYMTET_56543 [Cymbomonas tetramitiformis]